jgi:hypothetical protein
MEDTAIDCEVTCGVCGWHVAGTILPQEGSPFEEVMTFLKRCWPQHDCKGTDGELLIAWGPAPSATR